MEGPCLSIHATSFNNFLYCVCIRVQRSSFLPLFDLSFLCLHFLPTIATNHKLV